MHRVNLRNCTIQSTVGHPHVDVRQAEVAQVEKLRVSLHSRVRLLPATACLETSTVLVASRCVAASLGGYRANSLQVIRPG